MTLPTPIVGSTMQTAALPGGPSAGLTQPGSLRSTLSGSHLMKLRGDEKLRRRRGQSVFSSKRWEASSYVSSRVWQYAYGRTRRRALSNLRSRHGR